MVFVNTAVTPSKHTLVVTQMVIDHVTRNLYTGLTSHVFWESIYCQDLTYTNVSEPNEILSFPVNMLVF